MLPFPTYIMISARTVSVPLSLIIHHSKPRHILDETNSEPLLRLPHHHRLLSTYTSVFYHYS
jgi:hypothetical protein